MKLPFVTKASFSTDVGMLISDFTPPNIWNLTDRDDSSVQNIVEFDTTRERGPLVVLGRKIKPNVL